MTQLLTPMPNGDGTYLPMPRTGSRRIENEKLLYREHQRLHHELFPHYVAGWRRPSTVTVSRVWNLVAPAATTVASTLPARVTRPLSSTEREALVVVLDAAIQAGQDRRLLSHNLIFDALASRWSDWYRAAVECGPGRVSWEMSEETLKGAWRDLGRNEIDMAKMLRLAQNGLGLYETKRGRDGRYTVELSGATEELRGQFLGMLKEDGARRDVRATRLVATTTPGG